MQNFYYNNQNPYQTPYPSYQAQPKFPSIGIGADKIPNEDCLDYMQGTLTQYSYQNNANSTAQHTTTDKQKITSYSINNQHKSPIEYPRTNNFADKQAFLQNLEKSLPNYVSRTLAAKSLGLSRKSLSNMDSNPQKNKIEVKIRIKNRIFYEKNSLINFARERLS